jgi:hypothetical protein
LIRIVSNVLAGYLLLVSPARLNVQQQGAWIYWFSASKRCCERGPSGAGGKTVADRCPSVNPAPGGYDLIAMAKRLRGWLLPIAAIVVLIAAQASIQAGQLTSFDRFLNGARNLVPVGLALTAIGALLLLVAAIHGLITDGRPDEGAVTLDGRVVTEAPIEKGKVAINYRGRAVTANDYVLGFFRGTLLWGRGFYEESGMAELKRSWRSGEWIHVRRYLRATLALAGFLALFSGIFATAAILSDVTVIRLLFLLVLAYGLGRTAYSFARS